MERVRAAGSLFPVTLRLAASNDKRGKLSCPTFPLPLPLPLSLSCPPAREGSRERDGKNEKGLVRARERVDAGLCFLCFALLENASAFFNTCREASGQKRNGSTHRRGGKKNEKPKVADDATRNSGRELNQFFFPGFGFGGGAAVAAAAAGGGGPFGGGGAASSAAAAGRRLQSENGRELNWFVGPFFPGFGGGGAAAAAAAAAGGGGPFFGGGPFLGGGGGAASSAAAAGRRLQSDNGRELQQFFNPFFGGFGGGGEAAAAAAAGGGGGPFGGGGAASSAAAAGRKMMMK